MSRPRRCTGMRMAMIITTTATIITTTTIGMAHTIMPITITATIKASASSRMCTGRIAVTITMTTIIMTMAIPTTTPTRLMDAQNPKPDGVTPASLDHESPEPRGFAELPLLLWLSPAFPVGSFAYSHGLEWAVEAGDIGDAATLQAWLADLLNFGAPRSDAILFACAFRTVQLGDWAALDEINELAVALAGSAERRLETCAQGSAFVSAMRAAWTCAALAHLPTGSDPVAYPVAVGAAAAGHQLDLGLSLQVFVLSLIANLVSAAVRLGAIGQTDGQKTLAGILLDVRRLAKEAAGAGLDDLGSCAFRSDIAAMRHETQYSRLFRS
jgi:urease accessory protein